MLLSHSFVNLFLFFPLLFLTVLFLSLPPNLEALLAALSLFCYFLSLSSSSVSNLDHAHIFPLPVSDEATFKSARISRHKRVHTPSI